MKKARGIKVQNWCDWLLIYYKQKHFLSVVKNILAKSAIYILNAYIIFFDNVSCEQPSVPFKLQIAFLFFKTLKMNDFKRSKRRENKN